MLMNITPTTALK